MKKIQVIILVPFAVLLLAVMAFSQTNVDRVIVGVANRGADPNPTVDIVLQHGEYIDNSKDGIIDIGSANLTTTGSVTSGSTTNGNLKALSLQVGTPTGTPAAGSLQVQNGSVLRSTLDVDGNTQMDGFLFVGTPTMTPAAGSVGVQNNVVVGGYITSDGNIQTDGRVMVGTPTGTPTPGDVVVQNNAYIGSALNVGTRKLAIAQYSGDPEAATATLSISGIDNDDIIIATMNSDNSAYVVNAIYSTTDTVQITLSADPNASVKIGVQAWMD